MRLKFATKDFHTGYDASIEFPVIAYQSAAFRFHLRYRYTPVHLFDSSNVRVSETQFSILMESVALQLMLL